MLLSQVSPIQDFAKMQSNIGLIFRCQGVKSFKSKNKKKLPGLAKVAVVDRMAGLADIARLTGLGKFARLIRVATRKYCLVWFELPCWSEWPGSWWWGVSGQE